MRDLEKVQWRYIHTTLTDPRSGANKKKNLVYQESTKQL